MKKEKLLFRMSAFGSDNHETDEQWTTNAKKAPKISFSSFMLKTPVRWNKDDSPPFVHVFYEEWK
jgi:hypothetical protein